MLVNQILYLRTPEAALATGETSLKMKFAGLLGTGVGI